VSSSRSTDPGREVANLRERLHRHQVYLVAALAVFGTATLASVGLVSLYGFRIARSLTETEATLAELTEQTASKAEELERGLARQQQELTAIRKAANDDLEAMREANRKMQSVRDPAKELTALREANEALWQELASQRAELLEAFGDRDVEGVAAAPGAPVSRFRLGETSYVDPGEHPDAIKGFVKGDEKVFRASALPSNPAHLVIEVDPERVALGDAYRLSVRLVNRSNRSIVPRSMRLDWSFQGKNTGGDVPVIVDRVHAQKTELLYSVSGQWTEAHKDGPVSVTATVTVDGGARVSNVLSWLGPSAGHADVGLHPHRSLERLLYQAGGFRLLDQTLRPGDVGLASDLDAEIDVDRGKRKPSPSTFSSFPLALALRLRNPSLENSAMATNVSRMQLVAAVTKACSGVQVPPGPPNSGGEAKSRVGSPGASTLPFRPSDQTMDVSYSCIARLSSAARSVVRGSDGTRRSRS
jgi:hypothetical protein